MAQQNTTTDPPSVAQHLHRFILHHHSAHKAQRKSGPLVVGLQGPQGSGKTTVTRNLVHLLSSPSSDGSDQSLTTVALSIDDFYLTHSELDDLAAANPSNPLLHGRGQPGTHDLDLLIRTLEALKRGEAVQAPIFDKSLFDGEGDRSAETISVPPNIDVVLLEGWCLTFRSRSEDEVRRAVEEATQQQGSTAVGSSYFAKHTVASLLEINTHLKRWEREVYDNLDVVARMVPDSLENVFQWRLQAEHEMKAHNGGKGMSDQQVRAFIERYMPGYELFGQGGRRALDLWPGRAIEIHLDLQRQVTGVEQF